MNLLQKSDVEEVFHVEPSTLSGTITIPPSKSHTLRALLFGLMGSKTSIIHNYLHSPDTEAMLKAAALFGANIDREPHSIAITGVRNCLKPVEDVIQSGNSGQVLRFMGALSALLPTYTILTGDASIRHNRPIKPLLEALSMLGAFAVSSRCDDYAPIIIKGPIEKRESFLSGQDSQPVSALLMMGSFLEGGLTLSVSDPGEKPWIDLTLDWLQRLGGHVEHSRYETYQIVHPVSYDSFERTIPADFSSAAYMIAASVITNSELIIEGVDMGDVQGDKKFVDILIKMGALIDIEPTRLIIKKGGCLQGIRVNINDCIDMITLLPVVATFAEGTTEIVGGAIARAKECDRIHAITVELEKMGALIEEKEDGLLIVPGPLFGATVESYHDHRMTLALTVAALGARGESCILGATSVKKTYPSFKHDLQSIGARIS